MHEGTTVQAAIRRRAVRGVGVGGRRGRARRGYTRRRRRERHRGATRGIVRAQPRIVVHKQPPAAGARGRHSNRGRALPRYRMRDRLRRRLLAAGQGPTVGTREHVPGEGRQARGARDPKAQPGELGVRRGRRRRRGALQSDEAHRRRRRRRGGHCRRGRHPIRGSSQGCRHGQARDHRGWGDARNGAGCRAAQRDAPRRRRRAFFNGVLGDGVSSGGARGC